jgi:hypothetical protein
VNYSALILGLVFLAIGAAFLRAAKSPNDAMAKNKRLAATLFFVASAAFFVAFAFSAFSSGAAR